MGSKMKTAIITPAAIPPFAPAESPPLVLSSFGLEACVSDSEMSDSCGLDVLVSAGMEDSEDVGVERVGSESVTRTRRRRRSTLGFLNSSILSCCLSLWW